MKKGLKLLRGQVIGAYPAQWDPRAGACSNLHHAIALASIGSLWGKRLRGRKGNTDWLVAHDLWWTEAQRTRLAAGPLCSLLHVCTLRCSCMLPGTIQWSAGPAF